MQWRHFSKTKLAKTCLENPSLNTYAVHKLSQQRTDLLCAPRVNKMGVTGVLAIYGLILFTRLNNHVNGLAAPSQYAGLSRVELQALAKASGIKANLASDKIIALLDAVPAVETTKAATAAKAKPVKAPAAVAKAPAAVAKAPKAQPKTENQGGSRLKAELASTKPDVARVLDEQGLRISDLLELRKSLEAKQQVLDKRPNKTVEKKVASAATSTGSKKKPANVSFKPKPPAVEAASAGEEAVKVPAPTPAPKAKAEAAVVAAPAFQGWTPNFAVTALSGEGESSAKASSSFKSSTSSSSSSKASLDGVTLEDMLSALIKAPNMGFEGLFEATKIRAFCSKPTLTSSLKALRDPDMAWGREKIEALYRAKIVARK